MPTSVADPSSGSQDQPQAMEETSAPSESSAVGAPSNETANTKARKPISPKAKADLKAYFTSLNWPLNKDLPRGAMESELQKIVNEHVLIKKQVSRQLKNYKDQKYGLSQIKLTTKPEQLKDTIRSGLAMPPRKFVVSTLKHMVNQTSSNHDFNRYSIVLDEFPKVGKMLVTYLMDEKNNDSESCKLLTSLIDNWTDLAAELFPKTASGVSGAELLFQQKRREHKEDVFVVKLMEQYEAMVGADSGEMSKESFGSFGVYLYHILFLNWSYCAAECDKPPIEIPEQCLVGKYARNVIYYVAGWTLHSMSGAKTVAANDRQLYFDFVLDNTLDEKEAKDACLPTSLVERRKRIAKMFSSKAYFEFICFVESVYLANFSLEMMMAYSDGNLIHEIKMHMLKSDVAMDKFSCLCNPDEDLTSTQMQQLMNYIMERYTNIRGTYFVKHLKGTSGKSTIDTLVQSQANRDRVATAVAKSRVSNEANKAKEKEVEDEEEKQLWQEAAESVVEAHDKELTTKAGD